MNYVTQFGRPVLPPRTKRTSWQPTTEAKLGEAMAAFCMAETRRKGLTPGRLPPVFTGVSSNFGAHMVTGEMKGKVMGLLSLAPMMHRELVAATGMREAHVRATIFVLSQAKLIRYTLRWTGERKVRLWHIASPASGRSAPAAPEHEKGSPVSFSEPKRDVSQSAAPVAFPATGAQGV